MGSPCGRPPGQRRRPRCRHPSDPQRRARKLPLGTAHPRTEPSRRRRRVPPHPGGSLGPRRHRRGPPRMPSPGRAGDQLGVEPTHLTTHLLAMQQRPEFFDVLLDIAVEVELPIRLESGDAETTAGFPFRRLATEEGVSIPDHFRLVRGGTRGPPRGRAGRSRPRRHRSRLCAGAGRRGDPSNRPVRSRPLRRPRRPDRSRTPCSPRRSRGDLDRLSRTSRRTAAR